MAVSRAVAWKFQPSSGRSTSMESSWPRLTSVKLHGAVAIGLMTMFAQAAISISGDIGGIRLLRGVEARDMINGGFGRRRFHALIGAVSVARRCRMNV